MTLGNMREAGGPAKRAGDVPIAPALSQLKAFASRTEVERPVSMSTPVTEDQFEILPRGTRHKPTGRMYDAFLGTTRLGLHSQSSSGGEYDLAEVDAAAKRLWEDYLTKKEARPQRVSDQDSG